MAVATVKGWGRLGGYRVEFARKDDRVRSAAAVYESVAGATSALAAEGADAARGLRRAPAPPVLLGQQTVLYASPGSGPTAKLEWALVWRDHGVVAVLYSRGLRVGALVELAHIQEARISLAIRRNA